jgi:hypothetical protein
MGQKKHTLEQQLESMDKIKVERDLLMQNEETLGLEILGFEETNTSF